jgi:hypothetical protein
MEKVKVGVGDYFFLLALVTAITSSNMTDIVGRILLATTSLFVLAMAFWFAHKLDENDTILIRNCAAKKVNDNARDGQ